ncbi:hypothetical protein [Agrobacterium rosae]|uniref:hypothetical protein n=1 Tax=Agrobacterium rosae TaxID=1972867 RepID=UPI003A7FE229
MKTQSISIPAFTALALLSCSASAQDAPNPFNVEDRTNEIAPVASVVEKSMILNPQRTIVVEGDMIWSAMVTGARKIVFKPGSRLILNKDSPYAPGEFFVVAETIVVEDPNNPGMITWSKTAPATPPDRGEAPAGPFGGGNGAGGAAGTEGSLGYDAPKLTLMVRTIENGGLVIDMNGGDGGAGGIGQKGGQGGPGSQGSPARQARENRLGFTAWLPWCESGPGWGGKGGDGGTGGTGGKGGKGGAGGNVSLVSLPESLPTLFQVVRVKNGGGDGGTGGPGGAGGVSGPGGPEGPLATACSASGRNGPAGQYGAGGTAGVKGDIGPSGQPFVASLSAQQFLRLFGF